MIQTSGKFKTESHKFCVDIHKNYGGANFGQSHPVLRYDAVRHHGSNELIINITNINKKKFAPSCQSERSVAGRAEFHGTGVSHPLYQPNSFMVFLE